MSGSKEGGNTKLSTFHLWQKNTLRHCEARCHRDSRKRQNSGHLAHGLAGGPSSLGSPLSACGVIGPWAYRGPGSDEATTCRGHRDQHSAAFEIPHPATTTTTTTPNTINTKTTYPISSLQHQLRHRTIPPLASTNSSKWPTASLLPCGRQTSPSGNARPRPPNSRTRSPS